MPAGDRRFAIRCTPAGRPKRGRCACGGGGVPEKTRTRPGIGQYAERLRNVLICMRAST